MSLDSSRKSGISTADLSALGLDATDEEWLGRVRRALRRPALGAFGEYELLEEISRGAQGIVFRARQPNTNRIIAVKRLLTGAFATESMKARFEREVSAAAALQHSNIVTIFGMDLIEGQPVLAMEWVDGRPLDAWARSVGAGASPIPEILRVFLALCDAVHHAHQRGVIHRDLKPSNVLVDVSDEPRVLDFGLARLVDDPLESSVRVTRTHEFVGTPVYAAPERLYGRADAVDVRGDVYSLGVMLFETLTGALPYPDTETVAALLDAMRTSDPPPPSTLRLGVDRDLDAIVLKAVAKDPTERYPSVDALGRDLRRFQSGDPVEAVRPTRWYILRKTIHRYRRLAAGAVFGVILIAAFAVTLSVMYGRQSELLREVTSARGEEKVARESMQRHQKVLEEMLRAAAEIGRGADFELRRSLLDRAADSVEKEFSADPAALAAAHATVGSTYAALGLNREAERFLRSALSLRESILLADDSRIVESLNALSENLLDMNRPQEARLLLARARTLAENWQMDSESSAALRDRTLDNLGMVMQALNDLDAAESLHRTVCESRRARLGANHPKVADSRTRLAYVLHNRGDFDEARRLFGDALELRELAVPRNERAIASCRIDLGKALHLAGDFGRAEMLFRQAVETFQALLGENHDNVAWGMHRLGVLLHSMGRYTEAEDMLLRAAAIYEKCFDQERYVGFVLESLGTLRLDRGDFGGAEEAFRRALALDARSSNAEAGRGWALNRLAELRQAQGRFDEAEPMLRAALGDEAKPLALQYSYRMRIFNSLAELLLEKDESREAAGLFVDSLGMVHRYFRPGHPDSAAPLFGLGRAEFNCGNTTESRRYLLEAIALQERFFGADHPATLRTRVWLARCRWSSGAYEGIQSIVQDVLDKLTERQLENHRAFTEAQRLLADVANSSDSRNVGDR